jgi:hypothetical protein
MPQLTCNTTQVDNTPQSSERRVAIRYTLCRDGTCRPALANGTRGIPAWWADISTDGIGLIVEEPFEPRTMLVVELDGEAGSALRLRLARVRYVTNWGPRRWWLGCTLSSALTPEELQALLGPAITIPPPSAVASGP